MNRSCSTGRSCALRPGRWVKSPLQIMASWSYSPGPLTYTFGEHARPTGCEKSGCSTATLVRLNKTVTAKALTYLKSAGSGYFLSALVVVRPDLSLHDEKAALPLRRIGARLSATSRCAAEWKVTPAFSLPCIVYRLCYSYRA